MEPAFLGHVRRRPSWRKAAGRPDGGQFDRKVGQGSNDDLVPPEPSPDGASGYYLDWLGRMV